MGLTAPQRETLQYLVDWGGRMVMAEYGVPVFGDYGPTLRRLRRRRYVRLLPGEFPVFEISDQGRAALARSRLSPGPVAWRR